MRRTLTHTHTDSHVSIRHAVVHVLQHWACDTSLRLHRVMLAPPTQQCPLLSNPEAPSSPSSSPSSCGSQPSAVGPSLPSPAFSLSRPFVVVVGVVVVAEVPSMRDIGRKTTCRSDTGTRDTGARKTSPRDASVGDGGRYCLLVA